jgi:hypothetical protein
MKVIDSHCHIGIGRYKELTPDGLLRLMDKCDVDKAVVCPVEEHITVYNREGNDYVLSAVRRHPDRFIGFAVANPWFGEEATNELERAINEGLKGLKFNSSRQGFFINDPIVYPLIKIAEKWSLPVYFHTSTPIYALPLQLEDLARHFPSVNFIMGHSGIGDTWTDSLPAALNVDNIYLETSFFVPQMLKAALDAIGNQRVLFGSNSPVSGLDLEMAKIQAFDMNLETRERVMGKNIALLIEEVKI